MFKRCFQCGLCWNRVKYARITITHVCFIALTLAGSLGQCLNILTALCSNSFLGTRQMLMHEKTCVIPIFLHGYSLREAVWSRKIHVQIMKFMCCLNMAFTWKSLNWALICMHGFTLECVAAVTDHFANAFVRENIACVYMTLWRRNDVRKLRWTPFCFKKSSVRKWIFNV